MGLPAALDAALAARVEQVKSGVAQVWNGRGGFGAGILWRPGILVTSAHVLSRGVPQVTLGDGETLPAEPVALDEELDLAVLRLPRPGGSPIAVGDPNALRVGSLVLAVGHPWGERHAVSLGIFSGWIVARTRGPRGMIRLLRTDARLAPGNSGGPLVDLEGRVVGICTMVVGGDQGLAVPADQVAALMRRIPM